MDTNESKIYNVFLISAGILLLILFYYLFTIIRLQSHHRRSYLSRLGRQVMNLEKQHKQISENLHDELAPMITAAKMHISSVKTMNVTQAENILSAVSLLDQITRHMRTLSASLLPSVLEHKGITRAIEEYVLNVNAPAAPMITLNIEPLPDINYYRSVLIYRIVQEIIHNTCKHARAKHLHIHMYVQGNNMILATADDGIGFNYHASMKAQTGIGLTGLTSRVNLLEGTLKKDDNSNSKGTRYYISFPLNERPDQKLNK